MIVLTVAIPCYNSAAYMGKAIESALQYGEDIEIIVVDDGSTDNTEAIAKEYKRKYPERIQVVHQVNGGHGEAVNTGLKYANGLYFKVLDSDDWFDKGSLKKVLDTLKDIIRSNQTLDMLVTNYVYENVSRNKSKCINYKGALPTGQFFSWDDLGFFRNSQNILMHSVIYRTEVLRACNLELPKHTFYVDNIFVYHPLPYIRSMYYLDVDLYRYFIGRDNQSVNEKIMIQRIDQQIRVTKIMIDCHDPMSFSCKKLRKYMVKYLVMMMTVTTVLLLKENTEESMEKKKELWDYLKLKNRKLYHQVNKNFLGLTIQVRGILGRKFILLGYSVSRKIFGFN